MPFVSAIFVIADSMGCGHTPALSLRAVAVTSFAYRLLSAILSWFPDSRVIILPAVLKHLRYHIIQRDDQQEKSLESLGSILVLLHDMYQDVRGAGDLS